ncbi:MAG: FAD-dependent oxidoreductase [Thermoplasmatota archaeon]
MRNSSEETKKPHPSNFNPKAMFEGQTTMIKGASKEYQIQVTDDPECSKGCPAGVDVKAYINLIRCRRFEEAVEVIRKANPFPAVCGRVCTRPCEDSCQQSDGGDPLAIRTLKRFASDFELARRPIDIAPCERVYSEKIAVIGAGPAGLTAGVDLVKMGYEVTVFEAEDEPGGMLRYAIPNYRLPKRILKREIDWITGIGLNIETGKRISDPSDLLSEGYSAVIIGLGASISLPLQIEGEDAMGVVDPLVFLKKVNSEGGIKLEGSMVVLGGGSTAFDVARSAVRSGSRKVTIAYRRGFDEIPAEDEEIEEAREEGIEILTLAVPKKIITVDGRATGIELLKAELGDMDDSGRRKPIPIDGSEFIIDADIIVPAIGARPEIGSVNGKDITTQKRRVITDDKGETPISAIFAAGDVVTGPSSVVDAIGQGHVVSRGVHLYLRKEDEVQVSSDTCAIPFVLAEKENSCSECAPERVQGIDRTSSFNEVEKGIHDFEAVEEASRCATCGPCHACSICVPTCEYKQLVASVDDTTFLLKVPSDLSKEVMEDKGVNLTIETTSGTAGLELSSLTPVIDADLCLACGRCEEVCAYRAVSVKLLKGGKKTAGVSHDKCASCSACVSVCPSGAITQGFMSDNEILNRLKGIDPPFSGIKVLTDFWTSNDPYFGMNPGTAEIMSLRKLSPSFLIRALVRTGKGLLILGKDPEKYSHYLPNEESVKEIVEGARDLLRHGGISPERIRYQIINNMTDPISLMKQFSKDLEEKGINDLDLPVPEGIQGPLGEVMTILRSSRGEPEISPVEILPEQGSGGKALFEGCLPLLHLIGKTHKLFDLGPTRKSLWKLSRELELDGGPIKGLSCPAKGLVNNDIENIDEIIGKIAKRNEEAIRESGAKKILVATPEAYNSLRAENHSIKISSFIDEVHNHLIGGDKLSPLDMTVAVHPACSLPDDPFLGHFRKILELIPGIKVIETVGKCGQSGFFSPDGKRIEKAIGILKSAQEKGADMVICTSPNCHSHLLLSQRDGSWNDTDMEVGDIYGIILSSMGGGS